MTELVPGLRPQYSGEMAAELSQSKYEPNPLAAELMAGNSLSVTALK